MHDKQQIWYEVLESVNVSVSSATFRTWFAQTHLASLEENSGRFIAEIGCSSIFVKNTIESRYFGLVQDALSKSVESKCDILFIVKQNPNKKGDKTTPAPLFEKTEQKIVKLPAESLSKTGVRGSLTFKNFAVSSSNQMAWAAAEAVAESLGTAYNPLFIWGGVGVGKTHLMNSVGYSALEKNQDAKIVFCTGEQFTNDIVEGIRRKTTQEVRNKYRKLTALLIDDVQFIAGKDAVQTEFFHTFNSLVAAGGQVIMTSDKPPPEIPKLEERLKSRFEAGLIVDITQPDFELRCAIVQIKSQEREMEIPMNIVQLIAGNITSPRQLEGFLVKLISETRFKKTPMSTELVESLLSKNAENGEAVRKATPAEVITAASKYFSIGKRALLGGSRKRFVARPRQVLMYLLRTRLELPLQEVGRLVGGRDHTTVMHAVGRITQLASKDVQIREDISGIKKML